jgi:hypothetical protein
VQLFIRIYTITDCCLTLYVLGSYLPEAEGKCTSTDGIVHGNCGEWKGKVAELLSALHKAAGGKAGGMGEFDSAACVRTVNRVLNKAGFEAIACQQ